MACDAMQSFTLFGVVSCGFCGLLLSVKIEVVVFFRNVSKLRQTTPNHILEGSTLQCNEVFAVSCVPNFNKNRRVYILFGRVAVTKHFQALTFNDQFSHVVTIHVF